MIPEESGLTEETQLSSSWCSKNFGNNYKSNGG